MAEQKPQPGRPTHIAEFVEGKDAARNFEQAMKTIMSVPKQAVIDAEKEEKNPKKAT